MQFHAESRSLHRHKARSSNCQLELSHHLRHHQKQRQATFRRNRQKLTITNSHAHHLKRGPKRAIINKHSIPVSPNGSLCTRGHNRPGPCKHSVPRRALVSTTGRTSPGLSQTYRTEARSATDAAAPVTFRGTARCEVKRCPVRQCNATAAGDMVTEFDKYNAGQPKPRELEYVILRAFPTRAIRLSSLRVASERLAS